MQTFDDFLLLVYNEEREFVSAELAPFVGALEGEGLDLYAILLACNERNFAIFEKIDFVRECYFSLFKSQNSKESTARFLTLGATFNLEGVKMLQLGVLEILDSFPSARIFDEIFERISRLRREGVLLFEEEQRVRAVLHGLLSCKEEREENLKEADATLGGEVLCDGFLQGAIARITHAVENLRETSIYQKHAERFKRVIQRLSGQFSIGVTGVMNAGKSTMLNAILKREILGTNAIPETANLTILRGGEREYAVVHFWSEKEWEGIARSAQFDLGVDFFVKETIATFGASLPEYISDEGKSCEISLKELPAYTSAKHPSKLCNLVKSVEIFTPLEFLSDGVEIVDTPGLDDPLTQREEITKRYISNCDVMLHLMNAAQSATQKDVDFIVDSLVYKNVSRLLIVLTRADTLGKDELDSSMRYTTKSIKERLSAHNQKANLDEIISRIEFIPIASRFALMHRTGRAKEALECGYELEDTGILRVESYLREMLFGKNSQKIKVMLNSAYSELLSIFDEILAAFRYARELSSESSENLNARLALLEEESKQTLQDITSVKSTMSEKRKSLQGYLDSLGHSVNYKLLEVRNVLKERVIDDILYEESKGRKPTSARIGNMIELGIEDALTDLMRDYRHKFDKRLHFLTQEIESELAKFSKLFAPQFLEELLRGLVGIFDEEMRGARLLEGDVLLKKSIIGIIERESKTREREIEEAFAFSFDSLLELASKRSDKLGERLLSRFDRILERVYEYVEEILKSQKSVLLSEINMRESSENSREQEEKILLLEESKVLNSKSEIEKLLKEIT